MHLTASIVISLLAVRLMRQSALALEAMWSEDLTLSPMDTQYDQEQEEEMGSFEEAPVPMTALRLDRKHIDYDSLEDEEAALLRNSIVGVLSSVKGCFHFVSLNLRRVGDTVAGLASLITKSAGALLRVLANSISELSLNLGAPKAPNDRMPHAIEYSFRKLGRVIRDSVTVIHGLAEACMLTAETSESMFQGFGQAIQDSFAGLEFLFDTLLQVVNYVLNSEDRDLVVITAPVSHTANKVPKRLGRSSSHLYARKEYRRGRRSQHAMTPTPKGSLTLVDSASRSAHEADAKAGRSSEDVKGRRHNMSQQRHWAKGDPNYPQNDHYHHQSDYYHHHHQQQQHQQQQYSEGKFKLKPRQALNVEKMHSASAFGASRQSPLALVGRHADSFVALGHVVDDISESTEDCSLGSGNENQYHILPGTCFEESRGGIDMNASDECKTLHGWDEAHTRAHNQECDDANGTFGGYVGSCGYAGYNDDGVDDVREGDGEPRGAHDPHDIDVQKLHIYINEESTHAGMSRLRDSHPHSSREPGRDEGQSEYTNNPYAELKSSIRYVCMSVYICRRTVVINHIHA
jgi:hypothetical protein